MSKKLHEIMGVPPEYSGKDVPEFTEPPDEFNRFAWATEEKKPPRVRKIMLLLAAAGLTVVGIFFPRHIAAPLPIETEATTAPQSIAPDATPVATDALPRESDTPIDATPQPDDTATPTPEPTPVSLTGMIHILVYSEIFNMDIAIQGGYPSEILADETFDANSFESYVLPEIPEQEGYRALGYVLLAESGENYLKRLYAGETDPKPIGSVGLTDRVTVNDIAIVPLNDEGVREAEIHVVWLQENSDFVLEFYDGDLFGKYQAGFPVYSDGLLYLAAFPTPVREGRTFAGWRDELGNTVDAVTYFDFFRPLVPAETLEDRDWNKPVPCRLYALWSDGSGSAPEPMTVPMPDCNVVCYQTHSVTNCAVMLTDPLYTTDVRVRLWDEQVQDAVLEYTFTEQDIAFGMWSQEGIDLNDFYLKHKQEYEALNAHVSPILEAELSYRLKDGTEGNVKRSVHVQPEEYVSVSYHDEDQQQNDHTFPGCFVASVFDTENASLQFIEDPDQPLLPGEICVTVTINGKRIPKEQCRVEILEDSYEYEGVRHTHYTYFFVIKRPPDFPDHGTAGIRIRQRFLHFDYQTEKLFDLSY